MYAFKTQHRLHLRDRNAFRAGRCRAMTPAAVQVGTGSRYSLALYDDPHSEYSSKVKVAMHAKGLSWETLKVPCGGTKSADYLRINPLGKLPALLVHDTQSNTKEVVVESEVILEFLEDAFPQRPLLPSDPLARSKVRLLSRYHDLYLEPALRRLYPQVAPAARNQEVIKEATAAFLARLEELEGLLPHADLQGEGQGQGQEGGQGDQAFALTLGDCGYPALLYYAEIILPVFGYREEIGRVYDKCPRLAAWRRALWAHPAVQAVFAELEPAAHEWMESKLRIVA